MDRPITTLFMLSSVDGKISTGDNDALDVDKDFPKIKGVGEGLGQYYDIEKTTDLHSMNSGRVMAKVGANKPQKNLVKLPVSFLLIDNKPHLSVVGVDNFLKKSKKLYIITTNKRHPAFLRKDVDNMEIIYYNRAINFEDLFKKLKVNYGINRLTIQTGGTLNATLIRKGLIDKLSLVIAPAIIGGKDTASLVDGPSISSVKELKFVKALQLKMIKKLAGSYLYLKYDVVHKTVIKNMDT